MEFQFAVLGSVTFWIFYGCISLVVGTIISRMCAPEVFEWMTGKRDFCELEYCTREMAIFGTIFAYYLMWPLPLIIILIWYILKLVFGVLLFPFLGSLIKTIDKTIPELSIKMKGQEGEE